MSSDGEEARYVYERAGGPIYAEDTILGRRECQSRRTPGLTGMKRDPALLRAGRNHEEERRAAAGLAFDGDAAAVRFDQLFDDVECEPHAARPARVAL